jgi:hypothetical protein
MLPDNSLQSFKIGSLNILKKTEHASKNISIGRDTVCEPEKYTSKAFLKRG